MAAAAAATTSPARASWRPEVPATSASAAGGCFRVGAKRFNAGLQTAITCPHRLTRLTAAYVKSGVAEGRPSTEETAATGGGPDEDSMRRELETAIKDEDYARAAALRDELRVLQEDGRSAVLAANARFRGVQGRRPGGDAPGLGQGRPRLRGAPVGGADLRIRDGDAELGDGVRRRLRVPAADRRDVEVRVRGAVGYVTCLEMVRTKGSTSWGKQLATNVFEKVDGEWLMCVHHASHFDE